MRCWSSRAYRILIASLLCSSNFLGTAFSVYDDGVNPKKLDRITTESVEIREELASVLYVSGILAHASTRCVRLLTLCNDTGTQHSWLQGPEADVGAAVDDASGWLSHGKSATNGRYAGSLVIAYWKADW